MIILTLARISVISFLAHLISLYLLIKTQLKHYLIQKDCCTLLPHPILVYGPEWPIKKSVVLFCSHPSVSYLLICLSLTRARLAECILFLLWSPSPLTPGKSHWERSLIGYCPWGHKSRTRLSNWIHHQPLTRCLYLRHSVNIYWMIKWVSQRKGARHSIWNPAM